MEGWTWTTLAILLLVAGALEAAVEWVYRRRRRYRDKRDWKREGESPWWL